MKNKHGGGNVSNSIYYKGKKYGGGETAKPQEIQAEENELLVGDGAKWTKGSSAMVVKIQRRDFHDELIPDNFNNNIGFETTLDSEDIVLTNDPKEEKKTDNRAALTLRGAAKQIFEGTSLLRTSGSSRLTMSDSAEMDISHTAKVYIHDNAMIAMDSAEGCLNWDPSKGLAEIHDGTPSKPTLIMHNSSSLSLSGGACIKASEIASAVFSGAAFFRAGGANRDGEYYEPHVVFNTGNFYFGQNILDESPFYSSKRSPYFNMGGGSSFIMNTNNDDDLDPSLICSPTEFYFISQGSSGVDYLEHKWGCPPHVGSDPQVSGYQPNPVCTTIKISGKTTVLMDNSGESKTYLKICADSGKLVRAYITGNTFIQQSGNAHTEFNDYAFVQACNDKDKYPIFRLGNNSHNTNDTNPTQIAPSLRPFVVRTVDTTLDFINTGKERYCGWGSRNVSYVYLSSTDETSETRFEELSFITNESSYDAEWNAVAQGTSNTVSWIPAKTHIVHENGRYWLTKDADNTRICYINYAHFHTGTGESAGISFYLGPTLNNQSKLRYLKFRITNATGTFKASKAPKASLELPAISLTLKATNGVYSFDIDKDLRNNTPNWSTGKYLFIGLDSMKDIVSTSYDGQQLVSPEYSTDDGRDLLIGTNSRLSGIKAAGNNFLALGKSSGIDIFSESNSIKLKAQSQSITLGGACIKLTSDGVVSALIQNGASLRMEGAGTIVCKDGANLSFTGGTNAQITGGTFKTSGTPNVTVQDGAILLMSGSGTLNVTGAAKVTFADGVTVNVNAASSVNITDGAKLALSSSSEFNLSGHSTIIGETNSNLQNEDETSFTFKGAPTEESVTFTLKELKALKALLS